MARMEMDRYVTQAEAGRLIGVSRRRMGQYRNAGMLRSVNVLGRPVLFRKEVEAFALRRKNGELKPGRPRKQKTTAKVA